MNLLKKWNGHTVKYLFITLVAVLPFTLVSIGSLIYIVIRDGPSTTVTGDRNQIHIVPAAGITGFSVDLFCADPLTTVKGFPVPDSEGATYQLVRVRNGIAESVVVVMDGDNTTRLATHYYDSVVGQQSEPAVVNADARKCIEEKAK